MPLYGGIDRHANNSVIVLLNEQDEAIYRKRLTIAGIFWESISSTMSSFA
jgi:hypothetical protein